MFIGEWQKQGQWQTPGSSFAFGPEGGKQDQFR